MSLSTIDFTVLLAYILFIIWWALKNGKTENSDDYFLAGRNLL